MQATASSRIHNRNSRRYVIMLSVMCEVIKFNVVVLTIVMSRWPAVILAVSRTPSANGRINRLIVSIMTMKGTSGVGDPSGSMWASVIDGFLVIPVIIVAIHSGMAMAIFMDSCEVGVNVYGSRPSRFDSRIIRSRLVRTWHHFCPFGVSWLVMFDIIVVSSQTIAVVIRLPRSLGLWWIRRVGISIDSRAVGIINSSGLINCSNIFIVMLVWVWVYWV